MDQLRAVDALGAGWIAAVLVLAFGVLAWVNMVSPKQWTVLSRSFAAFRLGHYRLREDLDIRDRTLTGLMVLATLVIALFAYQVLLFLGWTSPGLAAFGRIALVAAGVVAGQIILLRLIAALPEGDGGLTEYLYTLIVLHVVLGLVLVPAVILMAFPAKVAWREWIWPAGVAIAAAVVVFRWVRAFAIGVGNGTPLRYIFLYICTLEILPVGLAIERAWHFASPSPNP
jgi:hypothetical protein